MPDETIPGAPEALFNDMPEVSPAAIVLETDTSGGAGPGPESVTEAPPKRKRGRPKGAGTKSKLPPKAPAEVADEDPAAEHRAVGASFALLIVQTSVMVGGKDFQADEQEFDTMAEAWAKYAAAHDLRDLPPGMLVLFTTATYYAKRLALPPEAPRAIRLRDWLVGKYLAWRMRRTGR